MKNLPDSFYDKLLHQPSMDISNHAQLLGKKRILPLLLKKEVSKYMGSNA